MIGGEGGPTWSGKHHTLETRGKISKAVNEHLSKESHEVRSFRQKEVWRRLRKDPDRIVEINAKRSISAKKAKHGGHKIDFRTRKKISDSLREYNAKLGRKHGLDTKPFKVPYSYGPIRFVTNGKVEYRVNFSELEWYLNHGYTFGRNPTNKKPLALSDYAKERSSGKGKFVVHNPLTQEVRRILPDEIQNYTENGWRRGYRK